MMAATVYLLCALGSLLCAALLFRSFRLQGSRLLFWATICFMGLAANNVLLFIDLAIVPDISLEIVRSVVAVVALATFLGALIWEIR